MEAEMTVEKKENKMGVMPVNKLLISMSLPVMASMLVQALYNIVDSIYVAKINEQALTAVSLAFPIQNLVIAVGVGTGVGVNAVLSRSLGEKDFVKANKAANNAIFLGFIGYLLFLVVGLFGIEPFYATQTTDALIAEYGKQYGTICCCLSLGVFCQITLERLLQSTGKTFYMMLIQGLGAIINIILDPILIFGLLGMPEMGVAGAAAATVTGQTIAGITGIIINEKVNHEIHVQWKRIRPDISIIKQIYVVGIPSIIMQAIASIMVYGMNMILIGFSTTATAVLGVYFKLQSFVFMPVFGLNNGMVPIVAYNYGANNRIRVVKTIRYSVFYAVSIMIIGLIIFQIFPDRLLLLFDASENMLSMGVPALRYISLSFVFAGYCIVTGSVFQALGNGMYSLINSVTRQLVVLLPAAYFLSKLGNVDYVWLSFPIAEISSLIMSTFFLVQIFKNIINKLDAGRE